MADILSQDEINALLTALPSAGEEAEVEATGKAVKSDKALRVKAYDFMHPDKFSKVQLHVLNIIHDNLARMLTTSMSVQLRTATHFVVSSVEQMTYEEFTRTLSNPTTMLIFRIDPWEGNAIWELNPTTTFLIFDRLLGGSGSYFDEERELTEIERIVIEKIGKKMLGLFKDSWHSVIEFQPVLETIESNPEFTQIVAPSEVVIVVTFEVQIGEESSAMNICLPYLTLKSVSSLLTTQIWYAAGERKKTRESSSPRAVESSLYKVNIPVQVELGETDLTIREFLGLKKGDAVKLDTRTTDLMKVKIGGNVKFLGRPGVIGRRMAVKVVSRRAKGDGNG